MWRTPSVPMVVWFCCLLGASPISGQAGAWGAAGEAAPGGARAGETGPAELPRVVMELGLAGGGIGAPGIPMDFGLGLVASLAYQPMPLIFVARGTTLREFRICMNGCAGDPDTGFETALMAGVGVRQDRLGLAVTAGPGWARVRLPRELGSERVGGLGLSLGSHAFYVTRAGNGIGLYGFAHFGIDARELGLAITLRPRLTAPSDP